MRNVRTQGSRSTGDPPNTSRHQVTAGSGSSSAGQPQIQPSQDSRVPGQGTSTLEEHPQEPLQTRETQVIPPPTRPHSPGSPSALSPTAQTVSGQTLNATGSTGGRQSTPDEGGDIPPPGRASSVTPALGSSHNTTTTLDTPPGDLRSGITGSSRHGKQRRLEPYSDEETGADGGDRGDVPMEDNPNITPQQQQYGGVCFIPVTAFSQAHPLIEPTRN